MTRTCTWAVPQACCGSTPSAVTILTLTSCWHAQVIAWCMVATLSVLIVASRKHYTVDVVIAWYVVPLVFYAMLRRWTTKRPVSEEPWPHRSMAEDNALQLEEIVVHSNAAAPEVLLMLSSHKRADPVLTVSCNPLICMVLTLSKVRGSAPPVRHEGNAPLSVVLLARQLACQFACYVLGKSCLIFAMPRHL